MPVCLAAKHNLVLPCVTLTIIFFCRVFIVSLPISSLHSELEFHSLLLYTMAYLDAIQTRSRMVCLTGLNLPHI
ncbi:hypothetical protein BDR04DRAFT_589144 [Suillus decipiens]|nr:hypothetical protein BDR04DRAFT_589144 [Suillus decipiens]